MVDFHRSTIFLLLHVGGGWGSGKNRFRTFYAYARRWEGRGLEISNSADFSASARKGGGEGRSPIFRPQSHVFGPQITFNISITLR